METGRYNNTNNMESECLLYCFGKLIQKDLDCFKNSWNSHIIRRQVNSNLLFRPAGRSDVLYFTPDFVTFSVRDYKSAISDDDVLLSEGAVSDEFYEHAGTICTENNISVAQNVTEALSVYRKLLILIREI